MSRRRRRDEPARKPNPSPVAPPPPVDPRVAWAGVPLRAFLGVTFVYAGFQKISDPGFLQAGAPTYIGTQLQGYAAHSPIAFLLTGIAIPLAPLVGLSVIGAELAVGVLVLLGVWTRWAAVVGAGLNLTLLLTASWDVQPYFLGSDGIFTVGWITLALLGDQGLLTLPVVLGRTRPARRPTPTDLDRRRVLLGIGAAAIGAVWLLSILPRGRAAASAVRPPTGSPTLEPSATPSAAATPSGQAVGTLTQLNQQGGSLSFTDPSSGDPALAVDLGGAHVVAFDAVCTHAGCTVEYDPTQKLIVCPCHGAVFDPAHGADVVSGPAPQPLLPIKVALGPDGTIYATG